MKAVKKFPLALLSFNLCALVQAMAFERFDMEQRDPSVNAFFQDEYGKNCILVEPEDPSWGWICDDHNDFPSAQSSSTELEVREPHSALDYAVAVATFVGTGFTAASTVVLVLIDRKKLAQAIEPEGTDGAYEKQCIANVAGEYSFTDSNGGADYLYYCLSKAATASTNCDNWLGTPSINTGMEKAVDWLNKNAKDAHSMCIQYKMAGPTIVRGKIVVSKVARANSDPCDLQCQNYSNV